MEREEMREVSDWIPGDVDDIIISHVNSSNMHEYINWKALQMKTRKDLTAQFVVRVDNEIVTFPAKVLQISSHTDVRYLYFDLELFICAMERDDFLTFSKMVEKGKRFYFKVTIRNDHGDETERPFEFYELVRHPFMMHHDIYTLTMNVPDQLLVRR